MDRTPADAWLTAAAVVDLRSADAYAQERPAGAVRLEIDDLLHRPYLLPPRTQALALVGGVAARMKLVLAALTASGHTQVRHLSEEAWRSHLETEVGPPTRQHLWEPSQLLVTTLAQHVPAGGRTALDLACGSGRNAVYLALHGYEVAAVDILPDALERCTDLATRSGVKVHALQRDLEFPGALDDLEADLVVVVRYLDRQLFGPLRRAVRPGGLLCYETFTTEQADLGHPRNPRFLLQPDELQKVFSEWELLEAREGFFDGAYLSRLVARAPTR